MDVQAVSAATAAPGDRDVDDADGRGDELPELGGGAVGDDGGRAAGENGGHPAAAVAQVGLADRVDTAVDAVEAAGGEVIPVSC